MFVRGNELLFLKDNTTLNTTINLSLFSFTIFFFDPSLMGGSFTLYSFLLDHLNRTLVNHLNLHSSTCPIKHLLWLSMNGGGWDCAVQGSSPHKCSQKSCYHRIKYTAATFLAAFIWRRPWIMQSQPPPFTES